MRALIDTCVLIDALQNRGPFADDAKNLILMAANNRYVGCITAKAATDIYYIMHRYTHDDRVSRDVLNKLFALFEVLDTAAIDCRRAIASSIADFEYAVMTETAVRVEADFIVTRNMRDYPKAPIKILTPNQFLKTLESLDE